MKTVKISLLACICAVVLSPLMQLVLAQEITIQGGIGVTSATIENLAINPSTVYENQTVDFSVTVKNTGEVLLWTRPGSKIEILSGENLITTLSLSPPRENIPPNSSLDFTASWNVGSTTPGSYQARATIYYDNSSTSKTENFSIVAGMSTEVAIPEIPAGGQENLAVENVSVTEIVIAVVNAVENVKIRIEQPTYAPENTPVTPKQAYHYLVFTADNIASADISSVTIKFSVERSWLQLNNLSESDVALCRLQGSTWQELPTSKIGENSTHVHYSATSPGFSVFAIVGGAAPTPSPPAAAPKPEIAAEKWLKLNYLPIVVELRPGETKFEYLRILNQSGSRITGLQASLAGGPENWISMAPSTFSLDAGEETTLNIAINVPNDARAGDYGLQTTLVNGTARAESISLVRVRPYPSGYAKASVTRLVALDQEENCASITLSARNGGTFAEMLEIVEDIPEVIADNVDMVSFTTTPTEMLGLGSIKWVLENLEPYETRTISYSVEGILSEYTSYAYWPVTQLTAVYERATEFLKVVDLVTPTLIVGENGVLTVKLMNMNTTRMSMTVKPSLPAGWVSTPSELTAELDPGDAAEFTFYVECAGEATPGLYLGELRVTYEGGEFTQGLTFSVEEKPSRPSQLWDYVPYLAALGCVIIIGVVVLKRPRKAYREKIVKLLKQIKRKTAE